VGGAIDGVVAGMAVASFLWEVVEDISGSQVLHGGANGNAAGVSNVIKIGIQVSQYNDWEVGVSAGFDLKHIQFCIGFNIW